jgi:DNA topoisomerase-1
LADGKSFDPQSGKLRQQHVQLDQVRATRLADAAKESRPWLVTALEKTPQTQRPAPPFITSTLQQEANRKLRMTAKQAMQAAQRLYEGVDLAGERVGLITYMRTDSVVLAERAIEQARQVIGEIYGLNYLPAEAQRYKTKAKRAQEAHEAIRPTDLRRRPQDVRSFLNPDEFRLYELIWKRTKGSKPKGTRPNHLTALPKPAWSRL